jgi:hypothetical protein
LIHAFSSVAVSRPSVYRLHCNFFEGIHGVDGIEKARFELRALRSGNYLQQEKVNERSRIMPQCEVCGNDYDYDKALGTPDTHTPVMLTVSLVS